MDRNFNINFESPLASSGQSGFIAGGALANVPVSTPKGTSEGGVCVTGLCSLVFICEKELPTKYCGGQIGGEGGSKMCIKQKDKCDVQCHKKLKAPFVTHRQSASGQYVLMGVGLQQDQAYLSHIVPVECFKADQETYANERRTVDNWDMFFRSIKQGVKDKEDVRLAADDADAIAQERESSGGSASPKKRTIDHRLLEEEYNTFGQFVNTRCIEDGGAESQEDISNSIDDLHAQMGFLTKKVKKTEMNQLSYPSDQTDRSLVSLRNLVGTRQEGMGPLSVMESVHNLTQIVGTRSEGEEEKSVMQLLAERKTQMTDSEVETFRTLVAINGSDLSILTSQLVSQLRQGINDRFKVPEAFFEHWTSREGLTARPQVYGDRLASKLDMLEAKLNSIVAAAPRTQQQSHARFDFRLNERAPEPASPSYGMGLQGLSLEHNQAEDQPGSTESMEQLMASVRTIQHEVATIKEQLDDTVIDVGGVRFNTKRELQAWLKLNVRGQEENLVKGKTSIHTLFPDALGLMGMILLDSTLAGGSLTRTMEYKAIAKKAGYHGEVDAAFMGSFDSSLPKVFGTAKADTDSRMIPMAMTPQKFDSGIPSTSFKSKMKKALDKQVRSLRGQAGELLTGEAKNVAKECINDAHGFVNDLMNWMTVTNITMKQEHGSATETDNWKYISQAVNAIFEKLAEERYEGNSATEIHEIVWSCFKGGKAQAAILAKDISGHSAVVDVLNQHLQASAVMKSEYTKTIEFLKKELDAVSKKANQALTAAQKKG